jgi:hypothetical protein
MKGGGEMNQEQMSTVQRAIGIIEGISFACNKETQDALDLVVEVLDSVFDEIKVKEIKSKD